MHDIISSVEESRGEPVGPDRLASLIAGPHPEAHAEVCQGAERSSYDNERSSTWARRSRETTHDAKRTKRTQPPKWQ
jgi:hypothetical protein